MSQNFENFGKYILLEKIATGGMAEVYLARNNGVGGVGKFVAIKRILPQFSEQVEFIDMFKDEAKIAINLSHSNIVSLHEFGMERHQFFIVMDFVEGRNLRQILNKMKKSGVSFSIEQVLYIIREVAAGLDHAHRCLDANTGKPLNIIHRDMSPQNVMVSFEGEVKIVDFGIAKAETQIETTRAGTLKGKFGYMSPEQAEGQSIDLRTDVFSLGIVLWELLANDRLFVANNEINTLRKIRDCQIPSLRKINPNISPELERIVSKALAKDKNLRYQTGAALHRELSRFLNRQYPDFSPQDFAVFIKTLFAGEILENRKKMVEFAKVDHRPESSSAGSITNTEKTALTGARPAQAQSLLEQVAAAQGKAVPDLGTPHPDSAVTMVSESDINFQQPAIGHNAGKPPRAAPEAPPPEASPQAVSAPPPPKRAEIDGLTARSGLSVDYSPREIGGHTSTPYSSNTYSGTRSLSGRRAARREIGSFIATTLVLALFGLLVAGGIYWYHPPRKANAQAAAVLKVLKDTFAGGEDAEPPSNASASPGDIQEKEFASVEELNVPFTIESSPAGADIIIDNQPVGGRPTTRTLWLRYRPSEEGGGSWVKTWTPKGDTIADEATINVELHLPGYIPERGTVTIKKGVERLAFSKQLKPKGIAYLSFIVEGAGDVFVDNKLIERSAWKSFPVPAGKPLDVRVIDAKGNIAVEPPFLMQEGASKTLTFRPRAPTGRPHPTAQ